MAFTDQQTIALILLDQAMNLLFFVDIILTFFTAYMD
jgi:hypothetical protein